MKIHIWKNPVLKLCKEINIGLSVKDLTPSRQAYCCGRDKLYPPSFEADEISSHFYWKCSALKDEYKSRRRWTQTLKAHENSLHEGYIICIKKCKKGIGILRILDYLIMVYITISTEVFSNIKLNSYA